jgi:pyruvate/2-oxoglutarate dehydrogenase complex dihydrolipoamide acyltransferase (E2) component
MHNLVTLPDLGVPPGTPVTLSVWYALPGDLVLEGERLVEVLTDGATFDVPAPVTGRLVEHLARPHAVLRPGHALGTIESRDPGPSPPRNGT